MYYLQQQLAEQFTRFCLREPKDVPDIHRFLLNGQGLTLAAEAVLNVIDRCFSFPNPPDFVIGDAETAAALVSAVVMKSWELDRVENAFDGALYRPRVKEHGTEKQIENLPSLPSYFVIIEGLLLSGAQQQFMTEDLRALGHDVLGTIAVVDWEHSGRVPSLDYTAILTKSDFYPSQQEKRACHGMPSIERAVKALTS